MTDSKRSMSPNDVRAEIRLSEVEMETVKVPNLFRIRWWQFRFRYRMWRQERRLVNLVQRKKIEEMNAALENQAIYGDGPWNPRS